jgi:ABC-type polysaccharide/polyol phosphate transport system ATPase subunit
VSAPPQQPFAVAVDGVSKTFALPHQHVNTLKERVLHPMRRTTYDRFEALKDVSFDVAPGEFFGIVGRNGSGKSTLLKCLAGIYAPDGGAIWLGGRMAPFIELGVGFNLELTARDNVIINAIMLGLTPAEARERYADIIAFAELEQFVDLKLKNYSSGMHVRLAFAVMVQVDADVLLIDEVLAVGDAAFQQKCHDTLQRMRNDGRTILLVTHEMDAVERFCDRAMLLERGHVVLLGEPHEVAVGYNEMNFGGASAGGRAPEPVAASQRRGDGAAQILDAWFEDRDGRRTEVLEQGPQCSVNMLIEANADLTDPVCGFSINDDQHRRVFATATTWVGHAAGSFAPGDRAVVALKFDMVFHPGRYTVTPFISHPGSGDHMMDLRERIASVVVTGTIATGGVVDLPHDLVVTRVGTEAPRAVEAG